MAGGGAEELMLLSGIQAPGPRGSPRASSRRVRAQTRCCEEWKAEVRRGEVEWEKMLARGGRPCPHFLPRHFSREHKAPFVVRFQYHNPVMGSVNGHGRRLRGGPSETTKRKLGRWRWEGGGGRCHQQEVVTSPEARERVRLAKE